MATPFGQRLRQARNRAKLTQAQASKKIEISQGTLSELENDAHSSGYTTAFAKLYGVDAHWLATGDGQMEGQPKAPELKDSEFDLLHEYRDMSAEDKTFIAGEIAARAKKWRRLRQEVLDGLGIGGGADPARSRSANVRQIPDPHPIRPKSGGASGMTGKTKTQPTTRRKER